MTSSTSSSEKSVLTAALPDRKSQLQQLKKLVLRILLPVSVLSVLFCFGLDWVIQTQLIRQTSTHGTNKLFRIQEAHPDEIPIFGSSRAQCSYIPDSLGRNFYNYGINGIGFAVMDIFLKQELAHQNKKTPIILNFDYQMFGYQMGDLNSYLPHSEIPEVKDLLIRNETYSNHLRIPGIRYYGAIDAFIKDRLNERLQLTKAINKGAAIEKAVTAPAQMAVLVQKRRDSTERFDPRPELVDTLCKRIEMHPNRMFYIVVAPYHAAYYASIPDIDQKKAKYTMDRLDAFPNAKLINFDTREWPDSLFFNTSHVSQLGAIKMSQMLKDSLGSEK
ncbi:MAG: hypothetical protein RLZZ519_1887 [Bacteroidota bacterium]